MAYSIDQNQIVQEVCTAAASHATINTSVDNWDNILITLCNHYDRYDQLNPIEDMPRWTLISAEEYQQLDDHPLYSLEDQTHVFKDEKVALVYKLKETIAQLKKPALSAA